MNLYLRRLDVFCLNVVYNSFNDGGFNRGFIIYILCLIYVIYLKFLYPEKVI